MKFLKKKATLSVLTVSILLLIFTIAYAGTTGLTNLLVKGELTVNGATALGALTAGTSTGPMNVEFDNTSGIYLRNKNGVRYRLYVNMTGTEASSIIAVKK